MSTAPSLRTKKTGKRIPVELTRGDVFEISACMSPNSHGLPKKPVLICPNELGGGRGSWRTRRWMSRCQSLTLCTQRSGGSLKRRQTKDREAHELAHLSTQPWCSVRVRAKGVDEQHLRRPSGERAEAQGVDHMPVMQFGYAYLSSINEKGEQVRMRTIMDTSTGYGTACAIDVKGGGDKYVISSAVSFLKELGYTRCRCTTDPEPAIKAMVGAVIKCLSDDRVVEQILPEQTIPESHASLAALEGWLNLLQGQARALRLDVEDRFWSIVGVTHQCVPWLVRHATWLLNRFQRRQNGATAFENLKGVSYKKTLMQFCERCHWLEAERITHKCDPRW